MTVRLRAHTRNELARLGERVDVVSRADHPPVPMTPLERRLIEVCFHLASVVDICREWSDPNEWNPRTTDYMARSLPMFERALEAARDLLAAVRSGEHPMEGTADLNWRAGGAA